MQLWNSNRKPYVKNMWRKKWSWKLITQILKFKWGLQNVVKAVLKGALITLSAYIKKERSGLPWWHSGWESACQCGGHGFEPWSGRIPHAVERLGPWATIAEPAHLEPVLPNKRGRNGERPTHRDEEWTPLATTRGSPRTETKTQHNHKLIN